MTEQQAIEASELNGGLEISGNAIRVSRFLEGLDVAIKALKKQAEYKALEEQGLLLRLKLKAGDTFWELNSACSEPYIYPRIAHSLMHVMYCMDNLGKVTFLTKEEAEATLEKMKGDTNEQE